jgi:hypothetical protein
MVAAALRIFFRLTLEARARSAPPGHSQRQKKSGIAGKMAVWRPRQNLSKTCEKDA